MKYLILISLLMTTASVGMAQSRKYTSCQAAKQIVEPSGSAGFFMDEECRTAYVLPPVTGEIVLAGYTAVVGAESCESYNAVQETLNLHISNLKQKEKDLNLVEKRMQKKFSQIDDLRNKCEPHARRHDEINLLVAKGERLLTEAQDRLTKLIDFEKSCHVQKEKHVDCYTVDIDIQTAKEKVHDIEAKTAKVNARRDIVVIELSACEKSRDREIKAIEESDSEYQKVRQDLQAESKKLRALLDYDISALSKKQGAFVTMSFKSKQNDLVREFKSRNQLLNLNFAPMPIDKAVISFNWIEDGVESALPVILKSHINGLAAEEGERMTLASQLTANGNGAANNIFGQAVSGEMVINLLTACRLQAEFGAVDEKTAQDKIAGLMLPTVTYTYGVQADRRVEVKYSEDHLYQLIKKNSSKNGLFRSKSSSSLLEKSEASKWIEITISSQDADNAFADAEKLAMDIRSEYLDAALMKVAKGYLTNEQAKLQEPGENGAEKAAPILRKCPNVYCQYAAVALDLGNALFGGKTSESNMTRIVQSRAGEKITNKLMVSESGAQSFVIRAGR